MATDSVLKPDRFAESFRGRQVEATDPFAVPKAILGVLASLKVTVVLFLLSIVLIYAGTLAQVEQDIWEVVHTYFRATYVLIPLQVFFPVSFFPGLAGKVPFVLPFPGGITIGGAMAVNLLAAHAIRFKIQARGVRLFGGLAVMALGLVSFLLAVASGFSDDGILETTLIPWTPLWRIFVGLLVLTSTAVAYGCFQLEAGRYWERILLAGAAVVLGLVTVWLVFQGDSARLNDSGMRILWQLLKGQSVATVLLVACYLLFKKRAGIVLLHGGIGLVMLSEVVVSFWAVEGQMRIKEGETVNFVSDIRTVELAVVDRSNPDHDTVVAIPKAMLAPGAKISDPRLPFDLEVLKFYENSDLVNPNEVKENNEINEDLEVNEVKENLATKGAGMTLVAQEARPVSGTSMGDETNLQSAYVRVLDKKSKQDQGTYLFNVLMSLGGVTEKIDVDGKPYEVELRHQRTYKPYSLTLKDVSKEDYVGTATPKDYASEIYLLDPGRKVDRGDVRIWMNNPLRFAGETFYQSGYNVDQRTGAEYTTLSVVSNFGWMIPYVGCMIVGTGMFFQFMNTLTRFLNRLDRKTSEQVHATSMQDLPAKASNKSRKREAELATAMQSDSRVKQVSLWCATATVALAALYVSYAAMKPVKQFAGMDLAAFGKLPLAHQGRVKPLDTYARNTLRILSGKLEFKDKNGDKQPAIRWLADMIARPEEAMDHKVFRIDNDELLKTLGLTRRKEHYYAISEFQGKLDEIEKQATAARALETRDLSVYQRKVLELEQKLGEVITLRQAFTPTMIGEKTMQEDVGAALQRVEFLKRGTPPLAIPPVEDDDKPKWAAFSTATFDLWRREIMRAHGGEEAAKLPEANVKINPAVDRWSQIFNAYAKGDTPTFNREVAGYQAELTAAPPTEYSARRVSFESFFNRAEPFYYAAVLYLGVFLLAKTSWIAAPAVLQRSAFWLLLFTFALHTLAIVARIYISGRPPVTNLYTSAVFIGWGCVALSIIFESFYRQGIGSAIGGVSGYTTLLIAHYLSLDGDTFGVMQAVLDTQFWLATHVVTVAMGYATTFLAGLFGIYYILLGIFTPKVDRETGKTIASSIYGILCFAIFFSFVGTVLGGLWADDSWGRFWGWDPKENGALIIVLWNAVVLHARWGKMVGDRGMAVLAVLGNICTCWSWFGVNELGVGLHSYGFTEGVLMWLGIAAVTHLTIAALGAFIPQASWRSFKGTDNAVLATLAE